MMDEREQPSEATGLTEPERQIVDHLIQAWNLYQSLPDVDRDKDDRTDFRRSIHELQRIIAYRIVRRLFFQFWR